MASMTTPFQFDAVGLGISFNNQQQHPHPTTSRMGALQNDYTEPRYSQAKPTISVQTRGLRQEHGRHQRAQSAIIPQLPTFDRTQEIYHAPRSAHPVQGPFPNSGNRYSSGYIQSAPTTPDEIQRVPQPLHFMTERRDVSRETVYDRRQQRRSQLESRPPHQYFNSPRWTVSPSDSYPRADNSSHSGSSYFYMTPSVQSTPFSEGGAFPVPDNYAQTHSNYHTPQIMGSPTFNQYNHRPVRYDEIDDMPEEPYVPTVMTNFPPLRPSALRRARTDESKTTHSSYADDSHSLFTSPASSPLMDGSHQKDRRVTYSRWTPTEDQLLREAMAKHGDGKWSLVSQMVPGRTPMQCSTRWQGALNTSIHKGRWDPEEDDILIKAVADWQAWHLAENRDNQSPENLQENLYKSIPWGNIASLLPRARTGVQALARWSEALDPRITKGKWTEDEDAALLRGINKYGKCWIKIANCVKGRTQRQCRTRFCQISDKKRKVRGGPADHTYPSTSELNLSE